MTSSPLRVGVIGAGQIVEDCHLPALIGLPGVTVAWVSDRDQDKARRVAGMYRTEAREAGAALDDLGRVDVALVAIPFGVRAETLARCAAAGVATYVEKPFAKTRAGHDALCRDFPPHRLAVGYQRRFHAGPQVAKSLIASGAFGPVVSVEGAFGSYSMKGGGRYHTDVGITGGGVTMEIGVHLLDLIAYVTDARSVGTRSVRGIIERGSDHHVIFEGDLRLASGNVPVRAEISRLNPVANGVTVTFARAALRFGLDAPGDVRVRDASGGVRFAVAGTGDGTVVPARTTAAAFRAIWESFLGGVREERVTPAAAVTGATTTDWVESIYGGLPV